MSRELKFRAWDGEQMHYDVVPWQWDFVISRAWHRCEKSIGQGVLGSGGKTGEFLVPGIAFKEIMQFTGLHDKNGKEIYEGDIVQESFARKVIVWKHGGFQVEVPDWKPESNMPTRPLCFDTWKPEGITFEVIGDIHRNPEFIQQ